MGNLLRNRRITQAEFVCCSGEDSSRDPKYSPVSSHHPSPSCRTRRLGFLCGSVRPSLLRPRRHFPLSSPSSFSKRTRLRAQVTAGPLLPGGIDTYEYMFQKLVNGTSDLLVKNLNGSEVFVLRQREDRDLGRRNFGFVRWLEESLIISLVNRISESCESVLPRVIPWRVRGILGGLFHAFRDPDSVDEKTELPVAIDPISVNITDFQSRAFAVSKVYLEIHNVTVTPRAIARFRRRALLQTWKQLGNWTRLWPVEDGPITDKSLLEEEIFGGPFNVILAAFVTPNDIARSPWLRTKVQLLINRMLDRSGFQGAVTATVTDLSVENDCFVAAVDICEVGTIKRSNKVEFRVENIQNKGGQDVLRVKDLKPIGNMLRFKFKETDISVGIGRDTKADLHFTDNGVFVLAKLKLAVPDRRLPQGDEGNFDFDVAYLFSTFLRKRINGVLLAGPRAPDEVVGDDFDERNLTKVKLGTETETDTSEPPR